VEVPHAKSSNTTSTPMSRTAGVQTETPVGSFVRRLAYQLAVRNHIQHIALRHETIWLLASAPGTIATLDQSIRLTGSALPMNLRKRYAPSHENREIAASSPASGTDVIRNRRCLSRSLYRVNLGIDIARHLI
jgi:hypothetical protein